MQEPPVNIELKALQEMRSLQQLAKTHVQKMCRLSIFFVLTAIYALCISWLDMMGIIDGPTALICMLPAMLTLGVLFIHYRRHLSITKSARRRLEELFISRRDA